MRGVSGDSSDIIAIEIALGQFYVEILDTDEYFDTDCELTPLDAWAKPEEPLSTIQIGTHIVGTDISTGVYAGKAGTDVLDSCSWSRLSGVSGEFSDIIAIDNPQGQFYVEIFDTDVYFNTGCELTSLDAWPKPEGPLSTIQIGTHIVGTDISPGIYAGKAGTDVLDSCSWSRLSGVSGEFSDIIAIDNPQGQFYVEIFDTDKYFSTSCVLELDDSVQPQGTNDAEVGNALEMYDDNGDDRITCAEARNHGIAPVPRGHPAYEFMRDADDDGMVCES